MNNASLIPIAQRVRHFLEPIWNKWHEAENSIPETISHSTCGRSSLFLKTVLERDYQIMTEWRNGKMNHALDAEKWNNHAWIETDILIIDLTADQFGWDKIIIASKGDNRYKAEEFDPAFPEYQIKRQEVAERLWLKWHSEKQTNF